MKKIFTIFLSALLAFSLSVPNVYATQDAEYFSTGSEGNDESLNAAKAFDGHLNTRWASDYEQETKELGVRYTTAKTFKGFQIFWERKNVEAYEIQASTSENTWEVVYQGGKVTDFVETVAFDEPVTATAFKVVIKRFNRNGYSQKVTFNGNADPFANVPWDTVSIYEFKLLENVETITTGTQNQNILAGASARLDGNLDVELSYDTTKLTDNNTDYASRWATNSGKTTGQVIFDMQALKKISALRFFFDPRSNQQGPNITKMVIYTSVDGTLWAPVYDHSGEPTAEYDVNFTSPVVARYIKLDIKQVHGRGWANVSMREVQAFSHALATPNLDNVTSLTFSQDGTQVVLPEIAGGTVRISNSSDTNVIALNKTVTKQDQATKVIVTLELDVNGKKLEKNVNVVVPARTTMPSEGGSTTEPTTQLQLPAHVEVDATLFKAIVSGDETVQTISLGAEKVEAPQLPNVLSSQFNVVENFNLTISKDGNAVTNLSRPVQMTLRLTNATTDRLSVVRQHGDVFTVLPDEDNNNATVTFTTDQFSNYTVVSEKPIVEVEADKKYDIVPLPHHIRYLEGTTAITNEIVVVKDNDVSDVVVDKVKAIFTGKNVTVANARQNDRLNIVISKNNQHPYFATANALLEQKGYDQHNVIVSENVIGINGKHDAAIMYGLQTLKAMVEQKQPTLQNVLIKDYADVKYRGFIEGYYGFPWSHENRLSLMEFAGEFKANTYIFAPKDDEYHSSKWRELYPESEQAKIVQLVEKGKASGTKFVWTLHPFIFGRRLNFNNFEAEMTAMKNKFEQLYALGVRQFGILADDVGRVDRNHLVNMLNHISQWAISKGDVEDILFCPAGYNHSWQGNYEELKKLNEVPDNVQIFWTGDTVVNAITQRTVDHFKNNARVGDRVGRDPYIWLNWPVNDYKKGRLLMGPGTVMHRGVTNLAGVVTNPMTEAQPSKVGIFATVNYAWNTRDFDADQVWEKGFKFVDKEAATELREISKHLQDVSPSGHGLVLEESKELQPKIEALVTALSGHASDLIEKVDAMLPEMQTIVNAIDQFNAKSTNTALKNEMRPWLDALKYQSEATILFLNAIKANTQTEKWNIMQRGIQLDELSKNQRRDIFPRGFVNVEVGAKRLAPLKEKLLGYLNQSINPQNGEGFEFKHAEVTPFISSDLRVVSGSLASVVDNDSNTRVDLKKNVASGGDEIPTDAHIGVEFSKVMDIAEIEILQTRSGAPNDKFSPNSVLEYSTNGTTYTQIALVSEADFKQKVNVKAKFVRLRNKVRVPYWASIREFKVTTVTEKPVFTNVASLQDKVFQMKNNEFTLESEVSLTKGQFIGFDLGHIRDIESVTGALNGLTVEYSKNNVVYHTDKQSARYVRFINNQNQAVTLPLNVTLTTNEIFPISVLETNFRNFEGILNGFDQNENTRAWLQGSQRAGSYVIYDLGQEVNIQKVKMSVLDSENDWLRHGVVEAKVGENWVPVLAIEATDDEDMTTAFTSYAAPNRYKENVLSIPITTRYLKLRVTKDKTGADKWVRFNEITINDGQYIPPFNRPQITKSVQNDTVTNNKFMIDDQVLKTSYKSNQKDELVYYIDHPSAFKNITLLTSGNEEMSVSVMNEDEKWFDLGTLKENYSTFNVEAFRHVLAVKLSWENASRNIHEILFDDYRPYLSRFELGNITTNSQETRAGEGYIELAFDGKLNTTWHTLWDVPINETAPAEVVIPLTKPEDLVSFIYVPRRSGANGFLEKIEIQVEKDGIFTTVKTETLATNADRKEIVFDTPQKQVTAVKLIVKQGVRNHASASEFVLKREKPSTLANEKAIALMKKITAYTDALTNNEYVSEDALQTKLEEVFNALIQSSQTDAQLSAFEEALDSEYQALEMIRTVNTNTEKANVVAKGIFDANFKVRVEQLTDLTTLQTVLQEQGAVGQVVEAFEIKPNLQYKDTTFTVSFKVNQPVRKVVHVLPTQEVEVFENLEAKDGYITVTTNSLSPFVVVYEAKVNTTPEQPKPPVVTPEKPPVVTPEKPPVVKPQQPKPVPPVVKPQQPSDKDNQSKPNQNGKKDVNTSDTFNALLWSFFVVASGLVVLSLRRKK